MLLGATGRPLTPERAAVVEHAGDPVTDLDGLESAAEGLVEGALHQPLEPALEPLESHGASVPAPFRPGWHPRAGRRSPSEVAATLAHSLGRVAELADAQASGACVRKDVGVQVPPRPPEGAGSRGRASTEDAAYC